MLNIQGTCKYLGVLKMYVKNTFVSKQTSTYYLKILTND